MARQFEYDEFVLRRNRVLGLDKESLMKSRSMISLVGGALAGATAMYLLDPDMGKKRRKYVAKQAEDYVGATGEALQSGWSKISDYAGDVGHTVADKAQDYGGRLSSAAQEYGEHLADRARGRLSGWADQADDVRADLADRADGWLSRGRNMLRRYGRQAQSYVPRMDEVSDNVNAYRKGLWKQARGLGGDMRDRASKAGHQARAYVGESQSPVIPVALTAVGCCAIGVGVMYIIDPRMGRARRAWLWDKSRSIVRRTGRSFYRSGRHVANRAYGMAAETRGAAERLVERVELAIQGILADPRVVQVMADANGTITLAGRLLTEECDRVLHLVESVPGVNLVINRMERMQAGTSTDATAKRNEGIPQM
jgi:gas vesicle protein